MSQIFISHSSKNNPDTLALRDWLLREGWSDFFIDLDPNKGIVAGEKWQKALYEAVNSCEAIIFLISREWLNSEWCQRELKLALDLNKTIFGVLIEPLENHELPVLLTEQWQTIALCPTGAEQTLEIKIENEDSTLEYLRYSKTGLLRLKNGLLKSGFNPNHFEWPPQSDPKRSPFQGLRPFDIEDAGIFFGRDIPVFELIGQIKHFKQSNESSLINILGASGAGKSSYLRAGIFPRLLRDTNNFIPLPIIRPEHKVLSGPDGFIAAIYSAIKESLHSVSFDSLLHDALDNSENIVNCLVEFLQIENNKSQDEGGGKYFVLAIDQAEELFLSDSSLQASTFLTLLAKLINAPKLPIIVLTTIRSDAYENLQLTESLAEIKQHTFSLPPIPKASYLEVIEGPINIMRNTKREILLDAKLTQQLLSDIESGSSRDALPILAFTLERLYLEFSHCGELTLEHYNKLGGLNGAISLTIDKAIYSVLEDPQLPNALNDCLDAIRKTLIPRLAGIDFDTLLPRRRVAKLGEFDVSSKVVIEHLVSNRLLFTDTNHLAEVTIEVAHESLLRQWKALNEWLGEDKKLLIALEDVQRTSRDWIDNNKAENYLAHSKGRLEDAEMMVHSHFNDSLSKINLEYIEACRFKEDALKNKELLEAKQLAEYQSKVASRTKYGFFTALFLLGISLFLLIWAEHQTDLAQLQRDQALAAKRVTDDVTDLQKDILKDLKPELITAGALALINNELLKQPDNEEFVARFNEIITDINLIDKIRNLLITRFIEPAEVNMLARTEFENEVKAQLLSSLQALYFEWGNHKEALKLTHLALALVDSEISDRHPLRIELINNLFQIYILQHDFENANLMLGQLQSKDLTPDDRGYFDMHYSYAKLLIKENNLNEAAQVLASLIVNVQNNQTQFIEATKLHTDVLTKLRTYDSAYDVNKNLITYLKDKNNEEALLYANIERTHLLNLRKDFIQAKSIQLELKPYVKEQLGEAHPLTYKLAVYHIMTQYNLGNYYDAIALENDIINTKNIEVVHPDVAQTITDLAVTLYDLEEYDFAESLSYYLLSEQRRLLGNNHPLTLTTMENLAKVYDEFEDEAAIPLWQELKTLHVEIYGKDHPATSRMILLTNGKL